MTATFGGIIRDLLAGDTPLVLHRESAFAQGLAAAALAHLGREREAAAALAALLALEPDHQPERLRFFHPGELVDRYAAGLRKAGLGG